MKHVRAYARSGRQVGARLAGLSPIWAQAIIRTSKSDACAGLRPKWSDRSVPVSLACRRYGRELWFAHSKSEGYPLVYRSALRECCAPPPPLQGRQRAWSCRNPGHACRLLPARASTNARAARAGKRNASCNHRRAFATPARIYNRIGLGGSISTMATQKSCDALASHLRHRNGCTCTADD